MYTLYKWTETSIDKWCKLGKNTPQFSNIIYIFLFWLFCWKISLKSQCAYLRGQRKPRQKCNTRERCEHYFFKKFRVCSRQEVFWEIHLIPFWNSTLEFAVKVSWTSCGANFFFPKSFKMNIFKMWMDCPDKVFKSNYVNF